MPYVNQCHLFFPQIVGIDHSDTIAMHLVINKREGAKGRPNFIDMTFVQLLQEAAVQMHAQQSLGELGKVLIYQSHLGSGHWPE